METLLPSPAVIVLVGPSGAGKSTWASNHFSPSQIVSSDDLRGMVGAGQDDISASAAAFRILEQIVDERVERKLTTVIDTLGLDDDRRQRWIQIARDHGLPVYAVKFDTDFETCDQRNASRARSIPKAVLRKQISRFKAVSSSISSDGFDRVISQQTVAVVAPQFAGAPQGASRSDSLRRHNFGLLLNRFDWPGTPEERTATLVDIAHRAERAGFRDIWVMDHFRQIPQVGRKWEDIPESYTALAYLAGQTETIRLGTLVTGVTHRNPVHLGKIIATLDVLSGGRANCGIGLGWDREEHVGYGWHFPSVAERYDLLEDTLRLLPLLWGSGNPAFEGKTVSATDLACYPRPIQERIPILVGGSGEQRTLRLVAEYADACNVFGTPERVEHKVNVLRDHCRDAGRDPGSIEVTHLTTVVSSSDRSSLRARIEALRGRNQPAEEYARRHNAGTVEDLVGLFDRYSQAGASHSIVSMPDAHLTGSIESFASVIAEFNTP